MNEPKAGIWITGASSGIGKAAATEFAAVGCNVFASARRVTELERLLKDDKHKLITAHPCNVASRANVEQTFKKIVSENKIDCLINSAGITSFKTAEENSAKEIDDIINTNLLGSIYTIKSVLPYMKENGGGTIINILSTVTAKTFKNSSAYTASKYGLLGYSRVLREEVRDYNIRVITVIPGATETQMWDRKTRTDNRERMMQPKSIARVLVSAFLEKDNIVTEEILLRPMQGDL